MRDGQLRARLAMSWRVSPAWQKALAVLLPLLLLVAGYAVAGRGSQRGAAATAPLSASTQPPPAAITPPPAPPTAPAAGPVSAAPTTPPAAPPAAAVTTAPAAVPPSATATSPAPLSGSAQLACSVFNSAVEPTVRQAVDNDDLDPALAVVKNTTPGSAWFRLTEATAGATGYPTLQRDVQLLGQDILAADPALSLAGLGSDLDAIDLDCHQPAG